MRAACQPSCSCLMSDTHTHKLSGSATALENADGHAVLTPAAYGVLPACHHILALLIFAGDHLKFNAGVSHSMVSRRYSMSINSELVRSR